MKVTIYKDILDVTQPYYKDIETVFDMIRGGKYSKQILKLRQDEANRDKLKKKLPAVVFQGLFNQRNAKGILEGSELACLDFDKLTDPIFFRDYIFNNYDCVYSAFISPSGNGVKALVRIPKVSNDKEYKEYYKALLSYFDNAKNDQSTKDICRVCFISYDPDIRVKDWEKTSTFTERLQDDAPRQEATKSGYNKDFVDIAVKIIREAQDGGKHYALLKAGRLLGGYVAGGHIEFDQALNLLLDEVEASWQVKSFEQAEKTAQDALKYGMLTPVQKQVKTQQKPPEAHVEYIRVGTNYYKIITKTDRYKIKRIELKVWTKDTIKLDHGTHFLRSIPAYDDFTIIPDNINYHPIVDNCYNLYKPFSHKPRQGDWRWTRTLLTHIFGDFYDLGLRYIQALYRNPDRILPVLVLVSEERQTGKTTFINWLTMVFGGNMVNISPESLMSQFNFHYCSANIIALEETLFEKSHAVDKIKSLSTAKILDVNPKGVNPFQVPFYGKIILTSNSEDRVLRIDQNEIRFFIIKVPKPKIENHNIENDVISEIPAFLYFLLSQPQIDFSKDRTGFTPNELDNVNLQRVKEESHSGLYKDLCEIFENFFLNEAANKQKIHFDPIAIKDRFFDRNNSISTNYIKTVLKNEFCLEPVKKPGFVHLLDATQGKTSRYYTIDRQYFNLENVSEDVPF